MISTSNAEKAKSSANIHLLPCTIDFNGPAPVKSYFQVSEIMMRGEVKLEAHFRGRQLIGETVTLPESVQGLCIHSQPSTQGTPQWTVATTFNELVAWEHDKPRDMGFYNDALDWFELSDAIHET